jgi:type VI secretion system secreted protein Hcp
MRIAIMNHRAFKAAIVAIGLGSLPAIAGADTFMLIQGVAGDATDPTHKGWIRVSSFEWGANMPVTTSSSDGGGATVARAKGARVRLKVPTGSWSRDLLNNLTRGTAFGQVVIDHVNPDGRPSFRVTLGTFLPTLYRNSPAARAPAEDEIEAVIGSFRAEFYTVMADGSVKTSPASWNFVTNTAN